MGPMINHSCCLKHVNCEYVCTDLDEVTTPNPKPQTPNPKPQLLNPNLPLHGGYIPKPEATHTPHPKPQAPNLNPQPQPPTPSQAIGAFYTGPPRAVDFPEIDSYKVTALLSGLNHPQPSTLNPNP